MNNLIIALYKYFAKFVPKEVLEKIFIQPDSSKKVGYDELKAEILALPDKDVISDFDVYVVSIDENYLSGRINNSNKFLLFVEYGSFSVNHNSIKGVKESLAVTVAHNFSDNNNDNLNEILNMNKCLELLDKIIVTMQEEQEDLDFCADAELVSDPVEIKPVDPTSFYGCGGWCAIFKNANTIL